MTKEELRLQENRDRKANWKRWGPYLSERQWGTVREDYSADGKAWDSFSHDQARSRAYRWGEDGVAGISDKHQLICFALALWNGRDPILKERLFGLTGSEGNHGEDVKEYYYYLDSTPTHSYMKYLYKYPQGEFPYARLVEENRRRGKNAPEFELINTGIFDEDRYFDVFVEYAKGSPDDILIRIEAINRGPEAAELHLLPTLWFRNTWSWSAKPERPWLRQGEPVEGIIPIEVHHPYYGNRWLYCEGNPEPLFTENETNNRRLFGTNNASSQVKDGINDYVVHGAKEAVNAEGSGTKVAGHYRLKIGPGQSTVLKLRLTDKEMNSAKMRPFSASFDKILTERRKEADEFYATVTPPNLTSDAKNVMRQALAGMLWSKQFYHYVVKQWLEGDPGNPPRRWSAKAVVTTSGRICITETSSPCPTSGSTHGMRHGIWRSTAFPSRWWIRTSPRNNSL